jgi:hypothetical protein
MSGYRTWCHGGTNAKVSIVTMQRSDVYHLLPKCHVYIEVRIKFLASGCLLPYFLEVFVQSYQMHHSSMCGFTASVTEFLVLTHSISRVIISEEKVVQVTCC